MFNFTHKQLNVGADLPDERSPVNYRLLLGDHGSAHAFDRALKYERTGGYGVTFRSAIIKFGSLKLAGIGSACAFAAGAGHSLAATKSLALSASITLVAAYFYHLIWQIRRQGWRGGPYDAAMLRTRVEQTPGDGLSVHQKLFAQEEAVDGLRCETRYSNKLEPTLTHLNRHPPTCLSSVRRQADWTVCYAYSHLNPPACDCLPLQHLAIFYACTLVTRSASSADTKVWVVPSLVAHTARHLAL